jgi:hypothetical protein
MCWFVEARDPSPGTNQQLGTVRASGPDFSLTLHPRRTNAIRCGPQYCSFLLAWSFLCCLAGHRPSQYSELSPSFAPLPSRIGPAPFHSINGNDTVQNGYQRLLFVWILTVCGHDTSHSTSKSECLFGAKSWPRIPTLVVLNLGRHLYYPDNLGWRGRERQLMLWRISYQVI